MRLSISIKRSRFCGRIVALLGLAMFADCSARASPTASANAPAQSYYLVTQMRPERPDKIFRLEHAAYDLCVIGAKQKGISFQPFPTVPANFVFQRNIYASDGKQRYTKEVTFFMKPANIEEGCAFKLASVGSSAIIHGAYSRRTEQDEGGVLTTGPDTPEPADPVSQSQLDRHTEPKTIHGVQLKCAGSNCIVDPALVVIAVGRRPAIAASRIDDPSPAGSPLITEPVSLTVGKPIDLSEFKEASRK